MKKALALHWMARPDSPGLLVCGGSRPALRAGKCVVNTFRVFSKSALSTSGKNIIDSEHLVQRG